MKMTHHPDDATLLSYAAGALPASLSAVVSVHLAMCETCREEVRMCEAIGGALIDTAGGDALPPVKMPCLIDLRTCDVANGGDGTAIDAEPALAATSGDRAMMRLTGMPLRDIPWKRLGVGVWHYPISVRDDDRGDLRLLKVQRGVALPEHGHGGSELTLVIEGAYTDHMGTFQAGDLADLDDDVEHRPIADPEHGCICLIASERKARFTGVVGRLLQPLTGI